MSDATSTWSAPTPLEVPDRPETPLQGRRGAVGARSTSHATP